MNRRDLLKGIFSGIMVVVNGLRCNSDSIHYGKPDVQVFYEHDHYTAPGKWNIWYACDNRWHLYSDNNRAPYEFTSEDAAQRHVDLVGMKRYIDSYNSTWDRIKAGESSDGYVTVRKGPTDINSFEFMRHTESEAESFIFSVETTQPITQRVQEMMRNLVMASCGGEQCDIWLAGLTQPGMKKEILVLQESDYFRRAILELYVGENFHTIQARIHAFRRIK